MQASRRYHFSFLPTKATAEVLEPLVLLVPLNRLCLLSKDRRQDRALVTEDSGQGGGQEDVGYRTDRGQSAGKGTGQVTGEDRSGQDMTGQGTMTGQNRT